MFRTQSPELSKEIDDENVKLLTELTNNLRCHEGNYEFKLALITEQEGDGVATETRDYTASSAPSFAKDPIRWLGGQPNGYSYSPYVGAGHDCALLVKVLNDFDIKAISISGPEVAVERNNCLNQILKENFDAIQARLAELGPCADAAKSADMLSAQFNGVHSYERFLDRLIHSSTKNSSKLDFFREFSTHVRQAPTDLEKLNEQAKPFYDYMGKEDDPDVTCGSVSFNSLNG